ncbi:dentin matrix acidic phosphoprotein 1 [Selaginella moellendorffii]|uniref:dentin matrix acidic phosphoprotein 1 n=1 Tax=Selaginella moellendorffii TaxID=88036 RepID=UPI000D1CD136|nr:dentin matrix acidic phosphoprotein 1 [Selaginella moellendorffii]|eukprot:XP_002986822.2 dentin matrix acidic phosphoprotein 1 [Selaginella moellendorffii]
MRSRAEGDGDGDRLGATIKRPLSENKHEAVTPVAVLSVKARSVASDSKCYARRRRILRDDNKSEEWMPSTCPSKRSKKRRHSSTSLEDDFQDQDHDSTELKTRHRSKKSRRGRARTQKAAKVPKNFVQEQQKYFAEVDAFELQEEESAEESSSHELDQKLQSEDESSSDDEFPQEAGPSQEQPESTKDTFSEPEEEESESESGSGSERSD